MPCLAGISHGASNDTQTFPGVFIRAPVIDSLLLPKDLEGLGPSEAAHVARGKGEAHDKLDVQPQTRLPPERDGTTPKASAEEAVSTVEAMGTTAASIIKPALLGRAQTDVQASSQKYTLSIAPPLERHGQPRRARPPVEVLAALPTLPRGAPASVGGGHNETEEGLVGVRPEHDSMIIALKQGNLMCTSFHPELTADGRLHEFFVRRCALGQTQ